MSHFEEARNYIAGGVNSPVRAFAGVGGEPVFIRSAKGAWLELEDGRKVLETVMNDFYHRQLNLLVCTTIIETGIDIPNAWMQPTTAGRPQPVHQASNEIRLSHTGFPSCHDKAISKDSSPSRE